MLSRLQHSDSSPSPHLPLAVYPLCCPTSATVSTSFNFSLDRHALSRSMKNSSMGQTFMLTIRINMERFVVVVVVVVVVSES